MKTALFHTLTLRSGFTLIELMVVVSIIGILMSAGILTFTNAQKGSRDARRRADVNAIAKAQEQYYTANSYVYATSSAITSYFPTAALPTDPKTGAAYTMTMVSGNSGFCVCAALEQTGKGNATTAGVSGACAYATGGDYFCASQRQ